VTEVVTDQLDEIEHVERAAEFQPHDIRRHAHADGTRRSPLATRRKWITYRLRPVKRWDGPGGND
jgi:hypothetical protein